jgi:uncharacterized repeat protein (TIGR03803 family)
MLGNIRVARSRSISRSVAMITAAATLLTAICSAEAATYQVIYNFDATFVNPFPSGGLLVGRDGALYGTTQQGGANFSGNVFKLTPPGPGQSNWVYSDLFDFPPHSDVWGPAAGVNSPISGVVMDSTGALYGTTSSGSSTMQYPVGVVYKLTPPAAGSTTWTLSTLYDPGAPMAQGLIIDENDVIYGTTDFCTHCNALPTAFRIMPPGPGQSTAQVSVYQFAAPPNTSPQGRLYRDPTGALFGTMTNSPTDTSNVGFRLRPPPAGSSEWTADYVVFPGGFLGVGPTGSVIADANGALYGTMAYGGWSGCGTIYQVTLGPAPGTWGEQALSFTCGLGGDSPNGGLVMTANGSIFGTAFGQSLPTRGILFELDQPYGYGTLSTIHLFNGGADDGWLPSGDLAIDQNGNIFGTTTAGGTTNGGIVFMVTP